MGSEKNFCNKNKQELVLAREGDTYSLLYLAEKTKSELIGDKSCKISGVAGLEKAKEEEISFLSNPRYLPLLEWTQAGAIFITKDTPRKDGKNYLINNNPSKAFQEVIDLLFPPIRSGFQGIHETAIIHPSVKIGEEVEMGPHVVIDQGVVIGNRSILGAGTVIGPFTTIGEDCLLHPRVVIRERCRIGHRVVIQPGAIIGACGFGFLTEEKGSHEKLRQVGMVIIEDDVEIGANTTIDRARFETTLIGQGSKIDNLVQIGHGVHLGKNNLLVAQTGIAGSTETGSGVILGGQVAIAGHLKITDHVMVAGKSGVSKSIQKPGKYGGIPAQPLSEYNRQAVYLRRVEELFKKL